MLCLITLWGSSFVIVKATLKEGLRPTVIATLRFLVAGGLFAAALALNKKRNMKYALLIEREDFPKLLLLGLAGVTFFFVVQYTGIALAGASIAAILVCLLSPILISVFSAWIFKERLTRKNIFGIGIAATGTFVVIAGGVLDIGGNQANFLTGSLMLLLTPLLWATYTVTGKRMIEKYDPFLIVAYANVLGGFCLVPFSLAEGSLREALTMNINEWSAILYLAFACSLIGYSIWFYVLKQVKASVTSSFMFAEPVITIIFAAVFQNEGISVISAVGGLAIFAGVYLVTRTQQAHSP